ncbi:MarR family transcriptional regulator [soil metagenome]
MDPTAPAGPALIRIAALVTDRYEVISSELGVDFRTGRLLVAVARKPQTVGELSRYVRVSKSTMTGILARLVSSSLVVRETNPDDRRAALIAPTDRGREISETLVTRVRAEVLRLLEPIDPGARADLASLLYAILDAADQIDGLLPSE